MTCFLVSGFLSGPPPAAHSSFGVPNSSPSPAPTSPPASSYSILSLPAAASSSSSSTSTCTYTSSISRNSLLSPDIRNFSHRRRFKPTIGVVHCFRAEGDDGGNNHAAPHQHQQQQQQQRRRYQRKAQGFRNSPKSKFIAPGQEEEETLRTQEELLSRIVQEVRTRRQGDRESTPIVRALTWACRSAAEASEVDAIVADLDLPLPIFTSAVQKLGVEGRPQAAMAVFQWLQTAPGQRRPNVYTYNSLLGALKANGWYGRAQGVLLQMQASGVAPDVVTFNTLMSLYERQGQLDDAVELLSNLKALAVQPSLFTYRNLIQILVKKRDVEGALLIFEEFKQQQQQQEEQQEKVDRNDGRGNGEVVPVELKRESEQREQLEAIMTRLCCDKFRGLVSKEDTEKGEEALSFLSRIKSSSVRLNLQAYEGLIFACRGSEKFDHRILRVLYEDMRHIQQQQEREQGQGAVKLSLSVCNHVIRVLGRCKKWWAALEVYEHMAEYGPKPDAYTYQLVRSHFRVLLNAASKRRIWKWSLQLLDKMIEKGVEPDEFSWNAGLVACAKAGQTAAAVTLFQKMTDRGHKPGVFSYGALLSALEKSDALPAAEQVWEHMQRVGLKPNIMAYTTMISLYGKSGKFGEAVRLVDEMRGAGIQPSVVTFNALITACARAGDGDRAASLVEQMKAEWIQPDAVTYAQLIEAFANEGRWEPATDAYNRMQQLDLKPPPYAHDALVRVCKANNVPFDAHLSTAQ